jgi:hypothetical protein
MPNASVAGEATGLALPFAASGEGGLKLLLGDELILQYVRTYAADCDSDNPFQDVGIGLGAVFQVSSDPAWKGQVRRKMEQMFRLYLERANLARLQSISFTQTTEGETTMDVVFVSLESNEEHALNIPITRGDG